MKFTIFSFLVLSMIGTGCATTPTEEALKIKDADDQMVKDCKLVKTVTGTSVYVSKKGINGARADVLNEAADAHATHVVWENITDTINGATATGRAYQCVK